MTPTPSKPAPISGYRSRAINAVADFAAALRPVAGPGVRVTDGPGGKIISVDPRGLPARPLPWTVRVVPVCRDGDSPSHVEWALRVYGGVAESMGVVLTPAEDPAGTDEATGLDYWDVAAEEAHRWIVVAVGEDNTWVLRGADEPASSGDEVWRAIARVDWSGAIPRVVQVDVGVVDIWHGDVDVAAVSERAVDFGIVHAVGEESGVAYTVDILECAFTDAVEAGSRIIVHPALSRLAEAT